MLSYAHVYIKNCEALELCLLFITGGNLFHKHISLFILLTFFSLTEAVRLANQNVGETISVSKPLVMKKPVILPKPSLTGATITLSKDKPGMGTSVYRISMIHLKFCVIVPRNLLVCSFCKFDLVFHLLKNICLGEKVDTPL